MDFGSIYRLTYDLNVETKKRGLLGNLTKQSRFQVVFVSLYKHFKVNESQSRSLHMNVTVC